MPEKADTSAGKRRRKAPSARLERARKETGAGKLPSKYTQSDVAATADPHTDKNLDHGLDETFPASDPVSISPRAD